MSLKNPKGSDSCMCGDYRSQHTDGNGPCEVCQHWTGPCDGCNKFRYSRSATPEEKRHWHNFHGMADLNGKGSK